MMGKQNINENDMSNFIFSSNKGKDTSIRNITHKFTGQEYDAETGLYYYNVRYYDPEIGKFITADTIIPNPLNTQSFNRYSYVENNPINFNDPSGHMLRGISRGGGRGLHGSGGKTGYSSMNSTYQFTDNYNFGEGLTWSSTYNIPIPNNQYGSRPQYTPNYGRSGSGSIYSGTHSGLKTNPNMKSGGRNNKTKNNITVNYVDNFFQSPVVNDVVSYIGIGSTALGILNGIKPFSSLLLHGSYLGGGVSFFYNGVSWGHSGFGMNESFLDTAISALGVIPHPATMGLSLYLTGLKMEYNLVVKPVINFANYVESHPFEAQNLMLGLFGGR